MDKREPGPASSGFRDENEYVRKKAEEALLLFSSQSDGELSDDCSGPDFGGPL